MPTFLAQILSQIKAIWARLDGGQRLTIGVVVTATMIGLGAIVWYAGQPDYQVVNGGKDFREVTAALEKANIPYHTVGREVSVPRDLYAPARRALSEEGIGEDDSSGGLTSALGKTAKEAEDLLWRNRVRTVEANVASSKLIRYAKIAANQPRRRAFVYDEDLASATVMITLARNAEFYESAPTALDVAASGLGIPREKVTVRPRCFGSSWGVWGSRSCRSRFS